MAPTPAPDTPRPLPRRILLRAANLLTSTGQPTSAVQEEVFGPQPRTSHRRKLSEGSIAASIKRSLRSLSRSNSTSASAPAPGHRRANSEHLLTRPAFSYSVSAPSSAMHDLRMPRPTPTLHEGRAHEGRAHEPPTAAHPHPHEPAPDPPASPDPAPDEVKVPTLLLRGSPLLKVSAKKIQTRIFRLDPDQGQILWESKKSGVVAIESIKEIRAGPDARTFREQFKLAADLEPRWITVVYIADAKYKSLHLVAASPDVFRMWLDTLRHLYALRRELMRGVGNLERRQHAWERLYWRSADDRGDARLAWPEVKKLCRRLNVHAPEADLMQRFREADIYARGWLDFKDFQRFVKLLKARPELKRLYNAVRGTGPFDLSAFVRFMRQSQKSTLSDAALETLFHRFALIPPQSPLLPAKALPLPDSPALRTRTLPAPDSPAMKARTLPDSPVTRPVDSPATRPIDSPATRPKTLPDSPATKARTLPGDSPASVTTTLPLPSTDTSSEGDSFLAPPSPSPLRAYKALPPDSADSGAISPGATPPASTSLTPAPSATLSLEGFTSFLLSAENSPFTDAPHDMTRPLPEYYIASSHNTYLVGHQLVGVSTCEGYIRALLTGCRSVELDIYDGDTEPMIFHGKTLTSKVALREVCAAIAKYAFVASPYPVVISAEIHCSLAQQDAVAEIMLGAFGAALVAAPLPLLGRGELPSPEELRGRVLLKAKNLNLYLEEGGAAVGQAAYDTESSSTEADGEEGEVVKVEKEIKAEAKELKVELEQGLSRARNVLQRVRSPGKRRSSTTTTTTTATERDSDSELLGREKELIRAEAKEIKAEAKELKGELEQGLNRARNVLQRVRGAPSPSAPSPTPTPTPTSPLALAPPPSPLPSKNRRSSTTSERPKLKMSAALAALLVYTVGVKCRGFNKTARYAAEHVFSLSEKTANRIIASRQGMRDLVKHNRAHVVRVYPKGLRLNSSNYEPQRYWAAGAQLVAINWQTFDLGYMINHAMFQRNGRAGYVLKPLALRSPDKAELARRTEHFLDVTVISAQQLPRAKDKEGREILDKHIVDPFVEVSVLIPDWPHETGTGADATSTATAAARTITYRTGVVKNNGFNPVWEEALALPFDCVGGMRELIFVKFEVKEEDGDEHGPLAVYCSSLGSLEEGFRHLPLHDQQLSQYLFSTLFVQIQVRDVGPGPRPTTSLTP